MPQAVAVSQRSAEPHAGSGVGLEASAGFEDIEGVASQQLVACRGLARVVGGAVATLSQAGSGLQKGSSVPSTEPLEDPLAAAAAIAFLGACRGLGAALVGLAATLSGDVVAPLQELRASAEADCERRRAELARLELHAGLCEKALAESLQRKQQVSADLQAELDGQAKLQAASGEEGRKATSWMKWSRTRPSQDTAAASEARLQQAASLQAAIVQEIALRTDEAALAKLRAEEAARQLQGAQKCLGFAKAILMEAVLGRCAGAWEDLATALRLMAGQLRGSASELTRAKPPCPKRLYPQPSWLETAMSALSQSPAKLTANGASLAASIASIHEADQEDERHSEEALDNSCARELSPQGEERRRAALELELERERLAKQWASLEASQSARDEVHEARDIALLEREESLRKLQEELEVQQCALMERRRSLAMDQAFSLAVMEQHHFTPPEQGAGRTPASTFALNPDSPVSSKRRLSDLSSVPDCSDEREEDREADDDVEVEADAMWEMDWAHLPADTSTARNAETGDPSMELDRVGHASPCALWDSLENAETVVSAQGDIPTGALESRTDSVCRDAASAEIEVSFDIDVDADAASATAVQAPAVSVWELEESLSHSMRLVSNAVEAETNQVSADNAAVPDTDMDAKRTSATDLQTPPSAHVDAGLQDSHDMTAGLATMEVEPNQVPGFESGASETDIDNVPSAAALVSNCHAGTSTGVERRETCEGSHTADRPLECCADAGVVSSGSSRVENASVEPTPAHSSSNLLAADVHEPHSAPEVLEEPLEASQPTRPLPQRQGVDTKAEGQLESKCEIVELRRKMEEKRRLAELHNGEDHTTAPRTHSTKARMPGVHPAFAEKLEMRRRQVDAAAAASEGDAQGE